MPRHIPTGRVYQDSVTNIEFCKEDFEECGTKFLVLQMIFRFIANSNFVSFFVQKSRVPYKLRNYFRFLKIWVMMTLACLKYEVFRLAKWYILVYVLLSWYFWAYSMIVLI